ncbi:MAG: response regulator [Methylobacter sp.]|nr:response regulator [Methylobacter sp.]MDP2098196.1 response regulator [Methylobacter sp.]MDP2428084.1 response regulator [Methylobacter sp.]MDP3055123.1 response regulator [Methylobacter sp.]MDP3360881.1 response regulator [Methylobacter sp.]
MTAKNILFVDDDENITNGIMRQLRPYRGEWQLFIAKNGDQALKIMAKQPIDLIVSDIVMPGMGGDELLKTVCELYPATVRMVLSGYTDEKTLKISLEVAHQYLSKPCNAETLRESISQVFKIQACVRNPQIITGVGDLNKLPPLPKIYQELNAAITDEDSTIRDIADIFARDMVLSAKLLQLVNSPYFGLKRTVSNLTDAISLIGLKKLSSLVLSVHIRTSFPANNPDIQGYIEYLWQDACRASELARLISLSEEQQEDRPDQAYLGGLLHNMGLLIFLSRGGDKLKNLISAVQNTDTPIAELETAIFGFTRSEAAAYVLSLWKIPPRIIEAILLQNTPMDSDYEGVNALTAVHVAACLLNPTGQDNSDPMFAMTLDSAYLQRINKLGRLPYWQKLADKVTANQTAQ